MEHKNITLKNISEATGIVKLNYKPTTIKPGKSDTFNVGLRDVFLFSKATFEVVQEAQTDSEEEVKVTDTKEKVKADTTPKAKEEVKIETEEPIKEPIKAEPIKEPTKTETKKSTSTRGRKPKAKVEEEK